MSSSADADQMASTDKAVGDAEKDLSTMQAQTHMQETMDDNESEWEYEYSPNETETFYVTLDLSKADFRAQEQGRNNTFTSRGGWPVPIGSELFTNRRKATEQASQNSAASSAAGSDAERDDEDQSDNEDQSGISRKNGGKNLSTAPEDADGAGERVQILDLHSETPIISYKGRVFTGTWCENITTELLMTPHDETNSLPTIRPLDDHVDLLAASCSRITVKEQHVRPKDNNRRNRASAHLPQTVIPPVDLKASQERIDQRNFLADLIAMKRRRGETDDVTVIARSMQGKRAQTKVKITRPHRRGRWAHADKLEVARGLEERPRRAGRKKGSGRGKWALFPLEESVRGVSVAANGELVSRPTPAHWDDLEGQGDSPARMEDVMEVDEEGDELDEEEGDYDENDELEEEDEDEQGGVMDEDED